MNEKVKMQNGLVENIKKEFNMSNIEFHPENKEIPTYKQDSDQIDTIIVSNDIIPYITQRGILNSIGYASATTEHCSLI